MHKMAPMGRLERALYEREQAKWPKALTLVWKDGMPWPENADQRSLNNNGCSLVSIWRSCDFLAMVYQTEHAGVLWLSVNRTKLNARGGWEDGIAWEQLQRIKRQIGYGDRDAVEIYPRDTDVVNVSNMRHLWIFAQKFVEFAWRNPANPVK